MDYIKKSTEPLHISFDVDALDPSYVSSTGTRVDNGLHPKEVTEIINEALLDDQLVSLDVVEFNQQLGDPISSIESVKAVFQEAIQEELEEVEFFA